MIERDEFFTEIYKMPIPEGEEKLDEFYVDYIMKNGATEPTNPSDNLILASLGADGTVTFKKSSSKSWTSENTIGKKLKAGTRIKSNQLIESGSVIKKINTFAVVGMDGSHLVDFTTDGKKRYFCTVKDYNKDTSQYVDYYTE